jgi:hypothetical protein
MHIFNSFAYAAYSFVILFINFDMARLLAKVYFERQGINGILRTSA